MSAIPVYRVWVSVDGQQAQHFVARPTLYVRSSGYSSGDYETTVADVVIRYSACGTYRITWRHRTTRCPVPLHGPVSFDFIDDGGPHITILSGEMGVSNGP